MLPSFFSSWLKRSGNVCLPLSLVEEVGIPHLPLPLPPPPPDYDGIGAFSSQVRGESFFPAHPFFPFPLSLFFQIGPGQGAFFSLFSSTSASDHCRYFFLLSPFPRVKRSHFPPLPLPAGARQPVFFPYLRHWKTGQERPGQALAKEVSRNGSGFSPLPAISSEGEEERKGVGISKLIFPFFPLTMRRKTPLWWFLRIGMGSFNGVVFFSPFFLPVIQRDPSPFS